MTTELNGMIVVMEEDRKELKNCMEEVKREKELRSEIEREVCEEVMMKCIRMGEVIEKEIKELKTCMEELNKIKQLVKEGIESLMQLRQERGNVELTREEEVYKEMVTDKSKEKEGEEEEEVDEDEEKLVTDNSEEKEGQQDEEEEEEGEGED